MMRGIYEGKGPLLVTGRPFICWRREGPSTLCTDTDSYLDAIIFILIEGGTAKCAKSKPIC